jgi:tetratricopeptide (TPR) repeat protein
MQLLYQHRQPGSDDQFLEKIRARRRQADAAARQLEEQYDREAGHKQWWAKRDDLRNLKETYENLAEIRDFKFKQLARKDQFNEFLVKYEINHPDIDGLGAAAIDELLSHGVETAADITEERLGQIPGLNESRARRLLNWRQELERKFVFDPGKRVESQPRIAIEKEIDSLRIHLEQELSGGAHYLRRVKQEIETDGQALLPALGKARRELAQAEKDLEVASKRNSSGTILAVLIIAFFIGSLVGPGRDTSSNPGRRDPRANTGSPPPPAPPPRAIPKDRTALTGQQKAQAALNHYNQGVRLSQEKKFTEAVTEFRKAVEIDPDFNGAYEELAVALDRLNRYEESAKASLEAIRLYADFGPYYNLGLAYIAQNNWDGAKSAFEKAITHPNKSRSPEKHMLAYYYLGLSKMQLGEAEQAIGRLEYVLKTTPQLTADRLELASLYLWVGRREDAKAQYEILKQSDPSLANVLMELMKKHIRAARRQPSAKRSLRV